MKGHALLKSKKKWLNDELLTSKNVFLTDKELVNYSNIVKLEMF